MDNNKHKINEYTKDRKMKKLGSFINYRLFLLLFLSVFLLSAYAARCPTCGKVIPGSGELYIGAENRCNCKPATPPPTNISPVVRILNGLNIMALGNLLGTDHSFVIARTHVDEIVKNAIETITTLPPREASQDGAQIAPSVSSSSDLLADLRRSPGSGSDPGTGSWSAGAAPSVSTSHSSPPSVRPVFPDPELEELAGVQQTPLETTTGIVDTVIATRELRPHLREMEERVNQGEDIQNVVNQVTARLDNLLTETLLNFNGIPTDEEIECLRRGENPLNKIGRVHDLREQMQKLIAIVNEQQTDSEEECPPQKSQRKDRPGNTDPDSEL